MSYILEALKKAQAERQLGSTPSIHDLAGPASVSAAPPRNGRLWLALGAALLLAAAAVAMVRMLTRQDAPAPQIVAPSSPQPTPLALAEPALPAPVPVVTPAPAPRPQAQPRAPALAAAVQPAALAPAPAPVQQVQPDDALPLLANLPQSLASGIPRVTLGGYIYSPVPSERLLLVDKDLRREGEEVAPGLVLEKLLPSAAVMNYRGTRFRKPY